MKKNLFRYHNLKIEQTSQPSKDIREHISRIVLGTPGFMRYRQKDASRKLNFLGKTYFLTLKKGNRLLGTVGLCQRTVWSEKRSFNSFYIRYFSILALLRSNKQKIKSRSSAPDPDKGNILKDMVKQFFDSLNELDDDAKNPEMETISYAFIETQNHRSMNFSSGIGFKTVRYFETLYFSRFYPKRDKHVSRFDPGEAVAIKNMLSDQYSDFSLFSLDNIFFENNYFVYKENNEIVAGVQANRVEWEIVEMPGNLGKFFMEAVPFIPLLSKLFKPDPFSFISLEAVYYKSGFEKKLIPLFESVCSILGVNVALVWLDNNCKVYHDLKKVRNMGFLSKIKKSVPAAVRINFVNLPEDHQSPFYSKPAYISAFDMT